MEGLEFYIYGSDLWCKYADGRNELVTEKSDIIKPMIKVIREQYPAAYHALSKE